MLAFGAEAFFDRVKGTCTNVAEHDTESPDEQGPFGFSTVPMSLMCCGCIRGRSGGRSGGWLGGWWGFGGWWGLYGGARLWNYVTHGARILPEEQEKANVAMLS